MSADVSLGRGPTRTAPVWFRSVGLVAMVAGLGLASWPAAPLWLVLIGFTLALSVGVPLVLSGSPRLAAVALPLVLLVVVVVGAWVPYARATGGGVARDRTHDGGVTVTREAARLAIRGENPYMARFDGVLPSSWARVQGADGHLVDNPVIDHEPYLPVSFLIQVPFVLAADGLGITWDPRVLGWVALVGAVVLLARRPGAAWLRVGAVAAVASAFTFTYLAWGTNDSLAACSFVVALLLAEDRADRAASPGWAGVFLALAISGKFLYLVAVPPLLAVVLARAGWAGVRRWWTLPGLLAASCLPYLVWSPADFLDDVLWFNLGRTQPLMPTSGLGLPALAPGTFSGLLLAGITLAGSVVAFGVVPWLAARAQSMAWVGPLTSLGLLALLVPARTFQVNYLVLVVASAATGWWALDAPTPRPPESAQAHPVDQLVAVG